MQQSALRAIARPSVCPSVRHTDGSVRTVEVSIMNISPQCPSLIVFEG